MLKGNSLKNAISLLAFIVFCLFLLYKFNNYYHFKDIKTFVSNNEEETTTAIATDSIVYEVKNDFEDKMENDGSILDEYYNPNNINYERIIRAKDTVAKQKLISLLNTFAHENLKEIVGKERLYFIKFLDGVKLVGDSNVRHVEYYQVLESEHYYTFPGKNLQYQMQHVKEYVDENTKGIIFWNGYNIATYKDAEDYVNTYQKLVDKVKEVNQNTDVYICSLMPATDVAIEKDLQGEIVHNIYRGKEYDLALKEHFKDKYIDIKFIGKKDYYGVDGIHFMPEFYYMLVPYLSYYLGLEVE